MGLKKGPLNGLLWVFRVFLLLGGLLDVMAGYYPIDMDHMTPFVTRVSHRRRAGYRLFFYCISSSLD
jgi:hypothetical protein